MARIAARFPIRPRGPPVRAYLVRNAMDRGEIALPTEKV